VDCDSFFVQVARLEDPEGVGKEPLLLVGGRSDRGVITSAGLILAGTFSILATLPLRDIFQLGFAVMLGVLLDTFVVRALFVPSLVILLRRWNWWPVRLKSPSSAEADAS